MPGNGIQALAAAAINRQEHGGMRDEGLIRLLSTTPYIRRLDLEDAFDITDDVLTAITPATENILPKADVKQPGHVLQHLNVSSATSFLRPANLTPDGLRRSALLGGGSASHSCASLESGPNPTLPLPGCLNELRVVFESQSPAGPNAASMLGFRSSSPMFGTTTQTSVTGHGHGSTGYASRPS